MEHVEIAASVGVALHPIGQRNVRLAEEHVAAFVLELQQRTLDGARRLLADGAVFGDEVGGMVGNVRHHGAQVFEVEQQPTLVVRHAKRDGQHARLHVGQPQKPCQQRRAHLADGGAHRVSARLKHIPKPHGIAAHGERGRVDAHSV